MSVKEVPRTTRTQWLERKGKPADAEKGEKLANSAMAGCSILSTLQVETYLTMQKICGTLTEPRFK